MVLRALAKIKAMTVLVLPRDHLVPVGQKTRTQLERGSSRERPHRLNQLGPLCSGALIGCTPAPILHRKLLQAPMVQG